MRPTKSTSGLFTYRNNRHHKSSVRYSHLRSWNTTNCKSVVTSLNPFISSTGHPDSYGTSRERCWSSSTNSRESERSSKSLFF